MINPQTVSNLRAAGTRLVEVGNNLIRAAETIEAQLKELRLTLGALPKDSIPPDIIPTPAILPAPKMGLPELILATLKENDGPLNRQDLLDRISSKIPKKITVKNIAPLLTRLKDEGKIRPLGGGIWEMLPKPEEDNEDMLK